MLAFQILDVQYNSTKPLNAQDLLPSKTTLQRRVQDMASAARTSVTEEVQANLSDRLICVTTDMWTDQYKQLPYITATAHYIDNDWKMKDLVLFTTSFDCTIKKTAINIHRSLVENFAKLGVDIEAEKKNIVFTTDKGPNIVSALDGYQRLDCAAHVMSTCLRHTLAEKNNNDAANFIGTCKSLVAFIKKKGYQNMLGKTLKQSCDSRWNSVYTMIASIRSQYQQLKKVLEDHSNKDVHRLTCIDEELLNEMEDFLHPFAQATTILEGNKYPIVHRVLIVMDMLLKHCENTEGLSPVVTQCKNDCQALISEKFTPHLLHKVRSNTVTHYCISY